MHASLVLETFTFHGKFIHAKIRIIHHITLPHKYILSVIFLAVLRLGITKIKLKYIL